MSQQTLLSRIQKAHELEKENENGALLSVTTPEPIMRPMLHQTTQHITEWAFKNAAESWEIIDSIAETYPFICGKIAEHLSPYDKAVFLDIMQYSYPGAMICALSASDMADLLCYFGVWSKQTYLVYQVARQQLKDKMHETGMEAFKGLLQKKVLPYKSVVPVVLEDVSCDRFDDVCAYLKEKGHFIEPDYHIRALVNDLRDQLRLIQGLNVVYEEKNYRLDDYIPPVTDWLSLGKKEAEKTAVYNTLMIMNRAIVEDKYQSIYSNAMDIVNDNLLTNAAALARVAVEKNPRNGIRTFLMTTDLASLYNADLTLMSEKEKNKKMAAIIDDTRMFISKYSSNDEWNRELVKWYDSCSLAFRGSLTAEPKRIAKHNLKTNENDNQKGKNYE